MVTFSMTFMDP